MLLLKLGDLWTYVWFTLLRPMCKWCLNWWTGRCELLRLVYRLGPGAHRSIAIESSLKNSKMPGLKQLLVEENVDIEDAVQNIMKIKSVSPQVHPQFGPALTLCLCQICGYRQLVAEVEQARRTAYCSENSEHEAQLKQLWDSLKPDTALKSRITKQWTEIGFQGDDPMTDFRGMGLLGLQNLLYLVTQYPSVAKQLLSHSHHPKHGYSFAIVGINITGLAYSLLVAGHLKTHFYNVVQGQPHLQHFHQVYCVLFYEFDKFWIQENPRDIMEFNRVKQKFQRKLIRSLRDKKAHLKGSFMGDEDQNIHNQKVNSVPSITL